MRRYSNLYSKSFIANLKNVLHYVPGSRGGHRSRWKSTRVRTSPNIRCSTGECDILACMYVVGTRSAKQSLVLLICETRAYRCTLHEHVPTAEAMKSCGCGGGATRNAQSGKLTWQHVISHNCCILPAAISGNKTFFSLQT